MMVADAKAAAQAAKQNLKNAKMDAKDSVRGGDARHDAGGLEPQAARQRPARE